MAGTADSPRSLDVNWLNREGMLSGSASTRIRWTDNAGEEAGSIGLDYRRDPDELELSYTITPTRWGSGEQRDVKCRVELERTECHFGGTRPWFRCPACRDRVGKLYKTGRYDEFVCRECSDLLYESQEYASDLTEALRAEREAKERFEESPDRETLRDAYEAHKEAGRTTLAYLRDLDERYGEETKSPLRDSLINPDEMPPFEEWADRLFYRAWGSSPEGRAYGRHGRCTALSKTTDERCRQPARGDSGKCYYHGGAPGSGIGEGQTDHVSEKLREVLQEANADETPPTSACWKNALRLAHEKAHVS